MILKKKIDGFRISDGRIRNMPPELLLELRQTWESFTGSQDQFRSELGVKTGTLRKLLTESKKLNHILASSGAMGMVPEGEAALESATPEIAGLGGRGVELSYDQGSKIIRFPSVDTLLEFLRKSA
jgi:hypothetical protein